MPRPTLLTLNIGSSTIKYAVFDFDTLEEIERKTESINHAEQIDSILKTYSYPTVITHRIVHGGDKFIKPTLLTQNVLEELELFSPFAPLHQPHNLDGVRSLQKIFPDTPHYGCFDTAFHARQDALHTTFAIPKSLREKGLRRYGFHGLSYQWVAHHFPQGKIVAAHLGSGASVCAVRDGISIDTSMGLTALDGLPMGTRCGSIDAGLVLYLARNLGYSIDDIEHILYSESGLKALSGLTSDVATLLTSSAPESKFALAYFAFKTAQYIAMMAVSLGGMDGIIFTGGVGEHAEPIRSAILKHLAFMNSFETHILPANEEKMMAIAVKEVAPHA